MKNKSCITLAPGRINHWDEAEEAKVFQGEVDVLVVKGVSHGVVLVGEGQVAESQDSLTEAAESGVMVITLHFLRILHMGPLS